MTPSNLPKVSIDVVPLRVLQDGSVQVGLGVRAAEPFKGSAALPGVLLLGGEMLNEAGYRALLSKVGVPESAVRTLGQVATFDSPTRDPRGHTLSVALFALVDPEFEGGNIQWLGLHEVGKLPFDHERIIASAVSLLASKLWGDAEVIYGLFGDSFSTARAHRTMVQLTGADVDKSNFNRTLTSSPLLKDTGYSVPVGKGRPSKIWAVTG